MGLSYRRGEVTRSKRDDLHLLGFGLWVNFCKKKPLEVVHALNKTANSYT